MESDHSMQEREREKFVRDFETGCWSMTELCLRYGVSRKTGYKYAKASISPHALLGFDCLSQRPRSASFTSGEVLFHDDHGHPFMGS